MCRRDLYYFQAGCKTCVRDSAGVCVWKTYLCSQISASVSMTGLRIPESLKNVCDVLPCHASLSPFVISILGCFWSLFWAAFGCCRLSPSHALHPGLLFACAGALFFPIFLARLFFMISTILGCSCLLAPCLPSLSS